MKIEFALLADYGSITNTGTANILGIFHVIYAQQMPSVHPKMVLALGIKLEEQDEGRDAAVMVALQDPEGRVIRAAELNIQVDKYRPLQNNFNTIIPFDVIQFSEYGMHTVRISINGVEQRVIEFHVTNPPSNGQGT